MTNKQRLDATDLSKCPGCGEKTMILIRLTSRGTLSKTEMGVCQNKKCHMAVDLEKIKTWKEKDTGNYERDFRTQNREMFNPFLSKRSRQYVSN